MAAALTRRIPVMMSPAEVAAIDDWRFARRIASRSEAIRTLICLGQAQDSQGGDLRAAIAKAEGRS